MKVQVSKSAPFHLEKKKKKIYTSVNQFNVRDSLVNIPQTICYKIKVGLS